MPITKAGGKKDGLQKYRVRVNYTDASGQHRQKERTAYGLSEAKELERKMMMDARAVGSVTVADLTEEFIRARKDELRASSLDNYARHARLYILPILGDTKIDKLTVRILQEWKQSERLSTLALTTKRGIYKSLQQILNYAVKMEMLPRNPLDSVGNFVEVEFKPHDEMDYYTADEFLRYMDAAKKMQSSRHYVFFAMAFYTGMRRGEINALKWSDIDGNVIKVRRSINNKNGQETPPKNRASIRDIQMPAPLINILAAHKARQMREKKFTEGWRVCGGSAPIPDSSLQRANIRIAAAAGLRAIRIHDFRHSHASLLCNEGINIQEVARRLGHSDIQTTWRVYAHLYPREEERAVNILNNIGDFSGMRL